MSDGHPMGSGYQQNNFYAWDKRQRSEGTYDSSSAPVSITGAVTAHQPLSQDQSSFTDPSTAGGLPSGSSQSPAVSAPSRLSIPEHASRGGSNASSPLFYSSAFGAYPRGVYQTPYQTPVLSPSNFTDTPSTGEPSFLPTPQLDTQSPLNFRNTQIEWPQAQHNSTEYSDLYSPTQPLSSQSSINISPVSHRFGRLYIGDPGRSLYPTSPVSHPEAPTNIHNDTTQQEEQGLLVSQDAGQHTHLLDGLSELSLLSQLPSGNYNSENYDATNSVPAETGPLSSIHSTAFNNAPPSPYSVQDTERITSATAHHHQPGHDGPSSVTYSSIMNWDHPRNIYMGQHRVGDMTGGYIMSPLSPQKPVFFDVSPEVGFGDLVGSDDLLPIAYDPQGQPIRHRRGGTSQKILDAAAKKRKRPQKYECEICHNRFTSRQNLGNHHNSHEGLLPHPCNLCQKRYRHSRSLNRHKTGAHGIPAKKKKTE